MKQEKHFTTRRGFIAASGFGGLSLYGLWAAYGAAPTPLALLGLDKAHEAGGGADAQAHTAKPAAGGAHSAHGGGAAMGPASEEFSRMTTEFVERYRMPDGSVYPRRLPNVAMTAPMPIADPHAGHDMAGMTDAHAGQPEPAPVDPHAGHDMGTMANMEAALSTEHADHEQTAQGHSESASGQVIDVLMVAGKWYYLPNVLRLDVGQPYRFRMMAMDVAHGASIQFGKGGRMMRLQPGRASETELTFSRAGRYLMHCTVYCGDAHDMMQATIEVV